jgi:DNA polymerase (family X)
VAASRDPEPVMQSFCEMGSVQEVLARGETKSSIRTTDGIQVDLRVVDPEHFGAALVYFTGSKAHNVRMRALALKQGLTLNEYGLARLAPAQAGPNSQPDAGSAPATSVMEPDADASTTPVAASRATRRARAIVAEEVMLPSATEAEVYSALGLSFIPPVQREDRGEVALAAEGKLPEVLELGAIRGDLHTHTSNSDGKNSIEEMAEAAVARGYEYHNITDHSKSQGIITGIEGPRYRDQLARVRAATVDIEEKHPGFRLLCGAEVNILPDGSLDIADEILAELDVVVASVHSNFRQPRVEMTARICRAVQSPHVDILGHPTGRKIEAREPYDVDLEQVFDACIKGGTAVEINASPSRLDLSDVFARRARDLGLKLSIGSDAHRPGELDQMEFGVYVAQRAWLQPDDILNCWKLEKLLAHVAKT